MTVAAPGKRAPDGGRPRKNAQARQPPSQRNADRDHRQNPAEKGRPVARHRRQGRWNEDPRDQAADDRLRPGEQRRGYRHLEVEGGQRRRGGKRSEQQRRRQAQKFEAADHERGKREQRGPLRRRPQPAAHAGRLRALRATSSAGLEKRQDRVGRRRFAEARKDALDAVLVRLEPHVGHRVDRESHVKPMFMRLAGGRIRRRRWWRRRRSRPGSRPLASRCPEGRCW